MEKEGKRKRRSFTAEYKAEAVGLVEQSGKSIGVIAGELGLGATALRRWGVRGCAARVAGEFGDHPDTAVARMCWARAAISRVYPAPSMPPVPRPRPLACAS